MPTELLDELRELIQSTRAGVAQAVNSALVLLYWQVGNRFLAETLRFEPAAYGEQIVSTLSRQLAVEFGNGYSRPNLFRMIRFAELFTDKEIVSALSRQLRWSHFVEILQLKDPLQRDFYTEMCAYGPKHCNQSAGAHENARKLRFWKVTKSSSATLTT